MPRQVPPSHGSLPKKPRRRSGGHLTRDTNFKPALPRANGRILARAPTPRIRAAQDNRQAAVEIEPY